MQALNMMTVNALMNGEEIICSIQSLVTNTEGRYKMCKLNNCQKDFFYYSILTLTQS